MTYHVVFPDFSGFQLEIPGAAPDAEPHRRGGGGQVQAEYLGFWPDSPGKEHSQPEDESGWRKAGGLPF